jgi:hypothetical protein
MFRRISIRVGINASGQMEVGAPRCLPIRRSLGVGGPMPELSAGWLMAACPVSKSGSWPSWIAVDRCGQALLEQRAA